MSAPPPPAVPRARILVVDDDASVRELLRNALEREGHTVTEAADGLQALDAFERSQFDLMLLDVLLPNTSGFEVLEQLHRRGQFPRVIVMTSADAPETVLKAIRRQAHRFLGKPFELHTLVAQVNDILTEAEEALPIEVISARPHWVEILVPCQREVADRLHSLMLGLKADLPMEVRDSVGQAFRELLLNAIEWGGKFDPNHKVRIAYLRTDRMLMYRIADPGQGFRFDGLLHAALGNPPDDPTQHTRVREDKGLRPGGFGIALTRAMVDELLYNEAQNEVVFVKYLD